MGLLSAVILIALFIFVAGVLITWWTPSQTGVGVAYIVAAAVILVDLLLPYVRARMGSAPPR